MLTRKQHELLTYIERYLRETGFSPSFEEMKEALQLRSKSGIHRLISALEERGFLQRRHHRARALEVTRMPEGRGSTETVVAAAEAPRPPAIQVGSAAMAASIRTKPANDPGLAELPFYGQIAAGLPIEALRDETATIEVPASMLRGGEHYALQISGDSMIEAGILNGDTVVIRRGEVAQNGEIVVALVDESEVTLKRLRRKGGTVALEPANARHEIRIFPADRVRVQGRLVGLLRQY